MKCLDTSEGILRWFLQPERKPSDPPRDEVAEGWKNLRKVSNLESTPDPGGRPSALTEQTASKGDQMETKYRRKVTVAPVTLRNTL